ncbi:MAG: tyrosine-type recombinase/integrase [Candidatus Bathyarchaeota archaeon]|nr:MAG: tyrosine-type recombinase/integrase [Candidatus Bathyarchaeota archaeon]
MEKVSIRRSSRAQVVGSNPADPTTSGTGAAASKIFKTLWELKRGGQSEDTLKAKGDRLRYLARHVNLDDTDAVKGYIANQSKWSNAYKQGVAYAYNSYVESNGLKWNLPHFRIEDRLPRIPTEEKINQVIVRARGKYVLVFSILRDTGMRPIELERTRTRDIDLERGIITVRTAKGGAARNVQIRKQTLALLKEYLGKHNFAMNDRPFPKRRKMTGRWVRLRNTVAAKLMDPTFRTIRLYDLRHFAATMTYHKTRDILYTQRLLGHRNLKSTLRYVQLIAFKDDDYTSAVARTVEEIRQLIEAGFEYVAEVDGAKVFRKRK